MKTQAWGWLVAGVVALGVNGIYHDVGASWAQRVSEQVRSRAESFMSGPTGQLLAEAELFTARNMTATARVSTAIAQVENRVAHSQSGFSRLQAMSANEEATCARLEAGRARMEAQQARIEARMAARMRLTANFVPVAVRTPVVCPRVRVNVPRVPMVRIPVTHVDLSGAGPA